MKHLRGFTHESKFFDVYSLYKSISDDITVDMRSMLSDFISYYDPKFFIYLNTDTNHDHDISYHITLSPVVISDKGRAHFAGDFKYDIINFLNYVNSVHGEVVSVGFERYSDYVSYPLMALDSRDLYFSRIVFNVKV